MTNLIASLIWLLYVMYYIYLANSIIMKNINKLFILIPITALTTLVLCASEFTIPKDVNKSKKVSAKKIKECTLEEIGDSLKLLIQLDQSLLNLRSGLQNEFEAGLYSEGGKCINSSSKNTRNSYLKLVKELNKDLEEQIINFKNKAKKLKSLKG